MEGTITAQCTRTPDVWMMLETLVFYHAPCQSFPTHCVGIAPVGSRDELHARTRITCVCLLVQHVPRVQTSSRDPAFLAHSSHCSLSGPHASHTLYMFVAAQPLAWALGAAYMFALGF
jgi:hypothetical protein